MPFAYCFWNYLKCTKFRSQWGSSSGKPISSCWTSNTQVASLKKAAKFKLLSFAGSSSVITTTDLIPVTWQINRVISPFQVELGSEWVWGQTEEYPLEAPFQISRTTNQNIQMFLNILLLKTRTLRLKMLAAMQKKNIARASVKWNFQGKKLYHLGMFLLLCL